MVENLFQALLILHKNVYKGRRIRAMVENGISNLVSSGITAKTCIGRKVEGVVSYGI